MNLAYKKDLRHNYMVIEEEEGIKPEAYCIRMLEEQKIEGILTLEQRFIDNKTLFYYDITGKQSVSNIFEKAALSYDKLKNFLSGILTAIERAYDYLLSEDDFILTPEFIYLDVISYIPELCYLSGYKRDIKSQLGTLLEYLMNKVNYNDKTAVLMVYQLYAASKEEGFTLQQLSEIMENQKKEVIPPKGEKIQKGELHQKRDLFQRRELLPKGELPHREDLLHSRDLYNQVEVQNKEEYQGRKEVKKEILNRGLLDKVLINFKKKVFHTETASGAFRDVIIPQNRNKLPLDNIPIMMERIEQEQEVAAYPLITYILTCICGIAGGLIIILSFTTRIVYNSFGNRVEYDKLIALVLIILCIEAYLMKKIWDRKNKLVKIVTKTEYIDPREEMEGSTNVYHTSVNSKIGEDSRHNASVKDKLWEDSRYNASVKDKLWEDSKYNAPAKNNKKENYRSVEKNIMNQDILSESWLQESPMQKLQEEEDNPTCLLSEMEAYQTSKSTIFLRSLEEETYQSIPITEFPFFIGKHKKNVDYCLEKDVISRFHAKITREGEALFLTDLNSKNGTFVNQELLQIYEPMEIKHGDEIAFANIRYQFEHVP